MSQPQVIPLTPEKNKWLQIMGQYKMLERIQNRDDLRNADSLDKEYIIQIGNKGPFVLVRLIKVEEKHIVARERRDGGWDDATTEYDYEFSDGKNTYKNTRDFQVFRVPSLEQHPGFPKDETKLVNPKPTREQLEWLNMTNLSNIIARTISPQNIGTYFLYKKDGVTTFSGGYLFQIINEGGEDFSNGFQTSMSPKTTRYIFYDDDTDMVIEIDAAYDTVYYLPKEFPTGPPRTVFFAQITKITHKKRPYPFEDEVIEVNYLMLERKYKTTIDLTNDDIKEENADNYYILELDHEDVGKSKLVQLSQFVNARNKYYTGSAVTSHFIQRLCGDKDTTSGKKILFILLDANYKMKRFAKPYALSDDDIEYLKTNRSTITETPPENFQEICKERERHEVNEASDKYLTQYDISFAKYGLQVYLRLGYYTVKVTVGDVQQKQYGNGFVKTPKKYIDKKTQKPYYVVRPSSSENEYDHHRLEYQENLFVITEELHEHRKQVQTEKDETEIKIQRNLKRIDSGSKLMEEIETKNMFGLNKKKIKRLRLDSIGSEVYFYMVADKSKENPILGKVLNINKSNDKYSYDIEYENENEYGEKKNEAGGKTAVMKNMDITQLYERDLTAETQDAGKRKTKRSKKSKRPKKSMANARLKGGRRRPSSKKSKTSKKVNMKNTKRIRRIR